MLLLKDITIGFVIDRDVYEVSFIYKGYTQNCGFEFLVDTVIYTNVPPGADYHLLFIQDEIVKTTLLDRHIYLDKREVNHLYEDTTRFYKEFILNDTNTCFREVIIGGGAGYGN